MTEKDLHPLTKKLLKNRGVVGDENIEKFLFPSYERDIYDPFLIYGMEKAVKRIIKAIKNEEMIAIYSDYDCDGIPGGVLLRDFFDAIGYKNIVVYIPHRHNEGYGLHKHVIDKLKKEKVSLMITVDSGITNLEEVKYAEDLGINVIVTDHHLPITEEVESRKQKVESGEDKYKEVSNSKTKKRKQIIPDAHVVINSKQDKCEYPDNMLCGSGVAWKLACAVLKTLKETKSKNKTDAMSVVLKKVSELPEGYEKWLLDMVGVATIADMVPLVNENRVLAHFGLKVLAKTKRPALQYIFRNAGVSIENINEEDVAFTIAPRINAAGRMGEPIQAHKMLYEKNKVLAEEYADDLEVLNNARKQGVKDILKTIDFDHHVYENDVVVVGDESWGPGILGLIAQAIIEETGKPTFVWGQGDDKKTLKGSCRSLGDVHVVELMQRVGNDVLTHWGGHEQAGGFSLLKENKEKLLGAFNEAIKNVEVKEKNKSETVIDEQLSFSDINDVTYNAIKILAPFGVGNSKPIFSFPKVMPVGMRRFGKQNEHIEVMYPTSQEASRGAVAMVKAIKFFADEELEKKLNKEHSLIANFEKSYFRGKGELRLKIIDVML